MRACRSAQGGWGQGGSGRALTITLGGDDPVKLNDAAIAIVDQMRGLPTIRSAADHRRPQAARDHHHAAARPCRQPGRDDAGAVVGDPHRDAGRYRPEFGALLAHRPPDSDPRRAGADRRASGCRRSRTCRSRPSSGGSVPLKVVAEIGFGAGPTKIERSNQQRRLTIGADLAPGRSLGRGDEEDPRAAGDEEPAGRRQRTEARRIEDRRPR